MKTIGLIGGMSWESTVTYYQSINRLMNERLGGLHAAKCLLYSVDFAEIEAFQTMGEWEKSGELLADAARRLEKAGADFLLICTNTMHRVAKQVQESVSIPLLHIADATADALAQDKRSTVALLGTRYTMQQDFYKSRLVERGFAVLIPPEPEMELVNRVIFEELCRGVLSARSKVEYLRIIDALAAQGAQGIILGCTEIGLLVQQQDTAIALYDTALLHAAAAVEWALRTNGE